MTETRTPRNRFGPLLANAEAGSPVHAMQAMLEI
jgi:hypothetical protein